MIIFKKRIDISNYIVNYKKTSNKIGFIPTMGALHNGHLSLIATSKKTDALTVCSIFVNPTQFNNVADFEKYPVTLEKDIELLEKAGCNVLFLPSVDEIYPTNSAPSLTYELGFIETVLDGKYRPGHFQGVCNVVQRLLNIVEPDTMYLGQKDYQQCMVIKKLTELIQSKTQIIVCPTLRESDGLAMSSRNMRLTPVERIKAVRISEVLLFIKQEIKPGNLQDLKQRCINYLTNEGYNVDYVEIADATNLTLLQNWDGKTKLVALVAAFLNEVRLIDNRIVSEE
jgi:pantoate--beta-alanine ligase